MKKSPHWVNYAHGKSRDKLKECKKRIIRRYFGGVLKIGFEIIEERGGNRGKRREGREIDRFVGFRGVKRDGRLEKLPVSPVATSLSNVEPAKSS